MTDLFRADNLHLNENNYDLWAAAIKDALIKYEGQYEHGMH
jgi:lysophospholipase L1-like esterase